MLQTQLNAMLAIIHQLTTIARELKKANELKALELRLKIQYEWQPATSAEDLDELADIMKRAE